MHNLRVPISRINPAPRDEGRNPTVAEACIRGIQVTLGTLRFSAFVTIRSHGNKLLHQQIAFSALTKIIPRGGFAAGVKSLCTLTTWGLAGVELLTSDLSAQRRFKCGMQTGPSCPLCPQWRPRKRTCATG